MPDRELLSRFDASEPPPIPMRIRTPAEREAFERAESAEYWTDEQRAEAVRQHAAIAGA